MGRSQRDLPGREGELTLEVFALFDRKVDDIQHDCDFVLPNAARPTEGCIVHPAEPRRVRVRLRVGF